MSFNLDKYIRELLLLHDCVILPGLGGFIANYRPASFDPHQKTATPPSRQILFNPNLIHNDGLLYAHISKDTDYGYKEVQTMAEVYFKTIRFEIERGLKYSIEDLGYFFLNKSRQIEFKQETTDHLLLDSYGLSYLNYREFDRMPAGKSNFYRAAEDLHPVLRQRRIRRWIYTGAAACLVAAMVLIPLRMGNLSIGSFDLGTAEGLQRTQPVSEIRIENSGVQAEVVEDKSFEAEAGSTEIPGDADQAAPVEESAVPEISYHIIVGSFKEFENARQLKQKMIQEGFKAEILSSENTFHRVSAAQFPQKEAAVTALSSIRDDQAYKSAWILSL
jgi:nucleoid DNA-binding protein